KVTSATGTHTHVGAGPIEVRVDGAQFRPGAAVLLSVRPEKLQLVLPVQGRIDGEVQERFFLGSQWLYRVGTPLGDLMVLVPNDGRNALDEGDRTGLDWPDHCMRLLPADEAAMAGAEAEATP
ncbi:MAG: TOBE domain-containing protein, partial [Acidovorax sp.]